MLSRYQIIILDVTSATTKHMADWLSSFYFENHGYKMKNLILFVDSGLKNQQLGTDKNCYGTVRSFCDRSLKSECRQIFKDVKLLNIYSEQTRISHSSRRGFKMMGAVPTIRQITKQFGFFVSAGDIQTNYDDYHFDKGIFYLNRFKSCISEIQLVLEKPKKLFVNVNDNISRIVRETRNISFEKICSLDRVDALLQRLKKLEKLIIENFKCLNIKSNVIAQKIRVFITMAKECRDKMKCHDESNDEDDFFDSDSEDSSENLSSDDEYSDVSSSGYAPG